jgi:citronellol/citronellal dehydrogenase
MGDAAQEMLIQEDPSYTGQFLVDEDVLRDSGVSEFGHYAIDPSKELLMDFFLD